MTTLTRLGRECKTSAIVQQVKGEKQKTPPTLSRWGYKGIGEATLAVWKAGPSGFSG